MPNHCKNCARISLVVIICNVADFIWSSVYCTFTFRNIALQLAAIFKKRIHLEMHGNKAEGLVQKVHSPKKSKCGSEHPICQIFLEPTKIIALPAWKFFSADKLSWSLEVKRFLLCWCVYAHSCRQPIITWHWPRTWNEGRKRVSDHFKTFAKFLLQQRIAKIGPTQI